VLVTAGFDPLRDEGEALRGRFASVQHVDAVDQVHGFLHFDTISPSSDAWVTRVVEAVGRLGRAGAAVAPAG
jgi:acetyl esterase/lipase